MYGSVELSMHKFIAYGILELIPFSNSVDIRVSTLKQWFLLSPHKQWFLRAQAVVPPHTSNGFFTDNIHSPIVLQTLEIQ